MIYDESQKMTLAEQFLNYFFLAPFRKAYQWWRLFCFRSGRPGGENDKIETN